MSAAPAQHRCRARGARRPDGYTFDIGQWDTHVGSIIYKLDYDLERDFEPIALVSTIPAHGCKNDLPANTFGELVTWMKENPGKINFVNQNAAANVTVYCSKT